MHVTQHKDRLLSLKKKMTMSYWYIYLETAVLLSHGQIQHLYLYGVCASPRRRRRSCRRRRGETPKIHVVLVWKYMEGLGHECHLAHEPCALTFWDTTLGDGMGGLSLQLDRPIPPPNVRCRL